MNDLLSIKRKDRKALYKKPEAVKELAKWVEQRTTRKVSPEIKASEYLAKVAKKKRE